MFGTVFNICEKRIKTNCHIESKPYIDFRFEVHYDV